MLLILGLAENRILRKRLASIPTRILVNGTRGKSSVTRLLAGALREAGIPTLAKTTGSAAMIILEDGSEIPVPRPLGPRITEQTYFARLAVERGAKAIVVECMAIRPESQIMFRDHLVRPTVVAMTNARLDHADEMGGTVDEVKSVLAESVPRDAVLVTADAAFEGLSRRVVVSDAASLPTGTLESFRYPEFAENVALALAAARELGIPAQTALKGMRNAAPDLGALNVIRMGEVPQDVWFVNGFAANDAESTLDVWKRAKDLVPGDLPLALIYNNRSDREYRLGEFASVIGTFDNVKLVLVVGENPRKSARILARGGAVTLPAGKGSSPEGIFSTLAAKAGLRFVAFGIGNIKGAGAEILAYAKASQSPRAG